MTQTTKLTVNKYFKLLLIALMAILAGCELQKQSGFNRDMQNLTTHFNILFNAKEILRQKQESYANSFADNYNEILSVYQDTVLQAQTSDKDLEAAITKAYNIINYKDQSKYIGDAYLVLGQANYLEGNFYNADEFLTYVIHNFPKRKDLLRDARIWKTRTLIYLNQLPQAKLVIDSAIQSINPKKKISADIYATKLQYDIAAEDYKDAEEMAKLALKYCHNQNQRLRWTFILAQVQELNNEQVNAAGNYGQISKSNALFEMAFNASLNLIRIEDSEKGLKIDRITKLLALLKNPNNKEFKDQIYYQVAQLEMADKKVDDAVKYYNLSVRASIKNQSQKGLSYLRLAEICFKIKADYLSSKKYYDSTLTSLPINYPGYLAIKKIGSNLSYLAERLQIIAREDTLQALARMDEKKRAGVIDQMVNDNTLQQKAATQTNAAAQLSRSVGPGSGSANQVKDGTFYFDNATAVTRGYNDFKRVWGNRVLEDNWRRSTKGVAEASNSAIDPTQSTDPDAPAGSSKAGKASATASNYRKDLVDALPLTPALLSASNQRIYNAYIDLGDFYRDILEDKKDAIEIFEKILTLFPQDPNKPAIYYNLYRLYSEVDPAKSDFYKNKLLKEFPATPFAKIIIDPEFARKLEGQDAEFTKAYNDLFDLYANKNYKEVIEKAPLLLKKYPASKLSAQIFYLQIISQGHNEKAGPFADSLQQLIKIYPYDKLIVPLAKQHLAYISANQNEMLARNVVIADVDPHDIPFTLAQENKKKATYRKIIKPYIFAPKTGERIAGKKEEKPLKKPAEIVKTTPMVDSPAVKKEVAAAKVTPKKDSLKTITQVTAQKVIPKADTSKTVALVTPQVSAPAETPANIALVDTVKTSRLAISSQADPDALKAKVVVPSIFSKGDSTNYYFAVNVASGTTNLASSRFGIGQFTRANYAGNGIRHKLKAVGDHDQVIYVGLFPSLESVKKYVHDIAPLLPDIMKVPKDKYSFFIITKENLDKLADQKTLDSYIDYYQNNY